MNALLLGLLLAAQAADAGAVLHDVVDGGPVVAMDAGPSVADADAGPPAAAPTSATDAGPPPVVVSELAREVATVRERPSPLVFRVPLAGRDARARANAASSALDAAIDTPAVEGAPVVRVYVDGDSALVTVRGRAVATMTREDAAAEGTTLEAYAAVLETRLLSFVEDELRRSSIQALALRVFLSVLFALIGVLTLRSLRRAFARWEKNIDESNQAPLTIFDTPVLSSDARKAVLLLGLAAGRVASFFGVVVLVITATFGQFDATRPLLASAASTAAAPLVRGVDALVTAVPGILLATGLVFAVRALLRFAELLLDGVAQGRVASRTVVPRRVLPARAIVLVGGTLIAAPLVAAAAFGRFGTPLETLALAAGACVFLAAVPALASAAAGVLVVWRGTLTPGDWVEVAGVRGEVSALHIFDVVIVPESGGTVSVPMLALVVLPLRRTSAPRVEVPVVVLRDKPMTAIEDVLRRVVRGVDANGDIEVVDATASRLCFTLHVPVGKIGARGAVVRAVVLAAERGELTLDDARALGGA